MKESSLFKVMIVTHHFSSYYIGFLKGLRRWLYVSYRSKTIVCFTWLFAYKITNRNTNSGNIWTYTDSSCLNCLRIYSHSVWRVPKMDYSNRFLQKSQVYDVRWSESLFLLPSGLLFVLCGKRHQFTLWSLSM